MNEREAKRKMRKKTPIDALAERRAKRFYTGLVLLLFTIQITILGTALTLAIGDPALAVVPDYHQAALNWDAVHAAAGAAKKFGWHVRLDVSDVADGRGLRSVGLDLMDDHDQPITDLNVTGKVYHHADANQVARFEMQNLGTGRYQSMLPMGRPGLWQLELEIENATEPMTISETFEL